MARGWGSAGAIAVVAALLGALGSTGFAPLELPGMLIVSVCALVVVLRLRSDASWRETFSTGVAWGLGFFVPLISWQQAIDWRAWVALAVAAAVYLGVTAVLMRCVGRLPGWPVWMAAVWTLGETARGSFPFHGFPWGRLVHTSLDTPIEGWVRLLGSTGTSFLMALLATVVAWGIISLTSDRRAAIVAAMVVMAIVAVGSRLPTGLAGPTGHLTVAVVQGGTPGSELRWPVGEIGEMHIAETQRLTSPVDLVLWPENSLDVDPRWDLGLGQRLSLLSARVGAPLLIGGVFNGPDTATAYNSGIVWTAEGPGDHYVKRRPVPWGEYVPFRRQLGPVVPRFNRDIPRDMLPGTEPGILHVADTVVGAQICWDVAFDDVVRDNVRAGAQLLVVQTSNAAYSGTYQPEQQWQIERLRAVETGRWVVVPSTSGISGVIDATGRVRDRLPLAKPGTLVARVDLGTGLTPAMRWGRGIAMAVNALALTAIAVSLVRLRRSG